MLESELLHLKITSSKNNIEAESIKELVHFSQNSDNEYMYHFSSADKNLLIEIKNMLEEKILYLFHLMLQSRKNLLFTCFTLIGGYFLISFASSILAMNKTSEDLDRTN